MPPTPEPDPPRRGRRPLGRGGATRRPRLGEGARGPEAEPAGDEATAEDVRDPRASREDVRDAHARPEDVRDAHASPEDVRDPEPSHATAADDVPPSPADSPAGHETAPGSGAPDVAAADSPASFDASASFETPAAEADSALPATQVPPAPADTAPAGAATPAKGGFTLRLDNFEGPFDLLLQLISRHKLDVTEVALSRVTDEFMAHIRGMGSEWDLDQTTEFLVVAATLLDLKAARLLPVAEVEDEADLALLEARDLLFARLLQYRAYKQVADIFAGRLAREARRFPRTVALEPRFAELLPDVVIRIGPEGFARLAVKAMQPKPEPSVYVDHIHAPLVSVREQAGLLVARLREVGEADFGALVADTDDTLTVVARFLALLELYREKAVALEQEEALGTLTVRWTGGEEDAAASAVTDEFDQEHTP
ncbi:MULTISPECIES: segregation/condensation protein A [Streptomyces]|uniref:Segregation and condensation protein A n=1 Tax=Streptomyces evansiae TaxID=3075535 RepID=A0ABU2R4J9_9ACTN|nr:MULTISPECIES: segregation/condensation protein A [unclassified Streptomyces]MDT0411624.1 segregation/condensation protein A [Streptomyces sp. DSM 41979]MYQ60317.1 segregation/condensation protein A [Streptomyces sp. SID4926]SCE49766.1 condensin subunit ScpA [Streptomyces sp. DfronAA-171]